MRSGLEYIRIGAELLRFASAPRGTDYVDETALKFQP
jgi:hypothetical protein